MRDKKIRTKSIELKNRISEIPRLGDFLDDLGEAWGLSEDSLFTVHLALDEIVSNTIRHGYDDSAHHRIRILLELKNGELFMTIEDDAAEFNPLRAPEPDFSVPLKERKIGGLGIFLVRKVMDGFSYERCGQKNIVTLWKKLKPR